MAEVILMPRLSDTMTEGVIAAWHKKVGDTVKKGDLLAEVETDKATMELESYKDGVLLHIGTEKGGKLQVNDLLAIIGTKGEDISSLIKGGGQAAEKTENKKAEPKKESASKSSGSKQPEKASQPATATATLDISKLEEVVLMPRLSDTMTEGVIASWNKNVGDKVKKGDILAEIETDKATMELESYKNGTLLYQGAAKGEKIQVNELLCIIGDKAKVDVNAIVAAAKGGVSAEPAVSSQQSAAGSQQSAIESKQEQPATGDQQPETTSSNGNGRLKASPLAKKLAKEKGIDLKAVHGSGDGGRIVKADVDSFSSQPAIGSQQPAVASQQSGVSPKQPATTAQQPVAKFTPTTEEKFTDTPNSQMRKTIARRLGESMFAAPHFYLTMEINMDNAMAARAQMNEFSPVKISFQDMIIKACAMALRQHPAVNSSWMGDFIRTYQHIHIGSAVAVPEGLIVPVIKFADQKSFSQIAAEAKELYGKARDKKLQPHEFSGNTFTISNLGMMDIEEFTAIINPPDSCIMAVGKIKEVVVKKGDGFGVTNVMKVTMSCDHRSVDGAVGAAFLQTVKKFMENPIGMLV